MNKVNLIYAPDIASHTPDTFTADVLADGSVDFLSPGKGIRYSRRALHVLGITACADLLPEDPVTEGIGLVLAALNGEVILAGQMGPYAEININ